MKYYLIKYNFIFIHQIIILIPYGKGLFMKAYYQGEIDYFCAIYAIINSVRVASRQIHMFTYQESCDFFQHLITFLYKNNKFLRVLKHGTSNDLMYELLGETKKYMLKKYKIYLHYKKLLTFRELPDKYLWVYLKRYLQKNNTSIILRLHNISLGDHWTVARYQISNTIKLFDSYFYKKICLDRTTFKPFRCDNMHHVQRSSVILIKMTSY